MSGKVEFVAAHEDLIKAFRSLAAFTEAKVDSLSRIRFTLSGHRLFAAATNSVSAGLAHISVVDAQGPDGHDGLVEIDILGEQAKKVVQAFKASGKEDEDGPGRELQVTADGEHVTFTDVSGFLDGQELTLPRPPMLESGPRLIPTFRQRLETGHKPHKAHPPIISAGQMHLLNAAAAIYGHALILEQDASTDPDKAGRVFARIGDQFLAMTTERLLSEEERRDRDIWRKDWTAQLSTGALAYAPGRTSRIEVVR